MPKHFSPNNKKLMCKEPVGLLNPRKIRPKPKPPTPFYDSYNILISSPEDTDIHVIRNSRKSFLENFKSANSSKNEYDLFKLTKIAFEKNDDEMIGEIFKVCVGKTLAKGELFDFLFAKYVKIKNTTYLPCLFSSNIFEKEIKQLVEKSIRENSVKLKFKQKTQLLSNACRTHNYEFAYHILVSPNVKNIRGKIRSNALFNILEKKIKEYYITYNSDKKSLFRLVSLKQMIENEEAINFDKIPKSKIKALLEISLFHNNIQFVEMWIKKKPKLLEDKKFKEVIRRKYVECLRTTLLDPLSRNGYGLGTVNAILDSEVLSPDGIIGINLNHNQLKTIFSDISPDFKESIKHKLGKFGIHYKIPNELINSNSSEDWAVKCLNGELDKIEEVIANGLLDLSQIKHKSKSLLYYAACYGKGDENGAGWPYNTLRCSLDIQRKDAPFQDLSERKNKIVALLMKHYKFTNFEVQEAFNVAYQDGIVKREKPKVFDKNQKDHNNLQTKYALRGDHKIMKQLIEAGADLSLGKSFMGIWQAITISYVSALSLDFALGLTTELLEEYLKVPLHRWYQNFASWFSAFSSAYTFDKTGVVIEYYHRTFNPDYLNNNLLDLSHVVVAGTATKNWYGRLLFGNALEDKMRKKVGITGVSSAIFDVPDISKNNIAKHRAIANRLYAQFKEHASGNKKRDFEYKDSLEQMNLACIYGIPGDSEYSFNNDFQKYLKKLIFCDDQEFLINSIISNKRNLMFFTDFAKGIEQGLIKIPLLERWQIEKLNKEISRRILIEDNLTRNIHNMNFFDFVSGLDQGKFKIPFSVQHEIHNVNKVVQNSEYSSQEWYIKLSKIPLINFLNGFELAINKPPKNIQKALNSLRSEINKVVKTEKNVGQGCSNFEELLTIYSKQTKNRIPLSLLLFAQIQTQRRLEGIGINIGWRIWLSNKSVSIYDGAIGIISPKFGITKDRGHELVAQNLSALISFVVGAANYYEKKLRSEVQKQGLLTSMKNLAILTTTCMTGLWGMGISPLWVVPVAVGLISISFCRHKKINPISNINKIYQEYKKAVIPASDKQKIFYKQETMDAFKRLFNSFKVGEIPQVVHYSL